MPTFWVAETSFCITHAENTLRTDSQGAVGKILCLLLFVTAARAQDLAPRAYIIAPAGSNALTFSYSWNNGEIVFDPSVPIKDARGTFHLLILSYYRSYSFFGRSSNIVFSVPYATGTFKGMVNDVNAQIQPSGMADARVRFSVNLRGGPSMQAREFSEWRENRLIGVSLTAVVPVGQNDRARAINIGTNRFAFKPEIGFTRKWQRVVVEGYTGMWVFLANPTFFPGNAERTQGPIVAFEGHAGYYVRPRLWASIDGNFWTGGRSSINGVKNQDSQKESRLGLTVSIPFTRHQSLKFSYSRGAVTRIGGNFQSLVTAWQYSWIGKPW